MRITNVTGLPLPLVRALHDDYSRGHADISATGLIAPARKAALEELYAEALEQDAADGAAILIGRSVHARIAAEGGGGEFTDRRRLYMNVGAWMVSGQTDHVDQGEAFSVIGGTVYDWKTTGVSEWRAGLRTEREQQLNIYAELLRVNGYEVAGLAAVLIFRDWSAPRARYASAEDYPPSSIIAVAVPLWARDDAQAYILGRVMAHRAARRDLPLCSDEERWLRDEHWALMRGANKRSTKNFDSEAEAQAAAAGWGVDYHVEHRPGVFNRCEYYCAVGRQGLCSQWNSERENAAP